MKQTFEEAHKSLIKRTALCKTDVTSLWQSLYARNKETNDFPVKAYKLINEFLRLRDSLPLYKQVEYVERIKINMSSFDRQVLNPDRMLQMMQELLDAVNSTPVHNRDRDFLSLNCWANAVRVNAEQCVRRCLSSSANEPVTEIIAVLWRGFSTEIQRTYENWYVVANEPGVTDYGSEMLRRVSENQSNILPDIIDSIEALIDKNEKLTSDDPLESVWSYNWTPLNRMRLLDELMVLYTNTEQ